MKKKIILFVSALCYVSVLSSSCAFAEEDKLNDFSYMEEGIDPLSKDYICSNKKISGTNNYSKSIIMDSDRPYAKAHYYNNTDATVQMWVKGEDSIHIQPYSSGAITWEKSFFTSKYEVNISCSEKKLNGTFSLAVSDSPIQ